MPEVIPNWHPILVHFTLALLLTASLLLAASALTGSKACLQAGRVNMLLGIVITMLTLWAGWHAYSTLAHDTPSHIAMTQHRTWALVSTALYAMVALWALAQRHRTKTSPLLALAALLAMLPLGVTGYMGGNSSIGMALVWRACHNN